MLNPGLPPTSEDQSQPNPRVESLAIPLARDYAEKNYQRLEDGTFEPAWRGRESNNKELRGKSPQQLVQEEEFTSEDAEAAVIDIANTPYDEYSEYWKAQNRGGAEFLIALLDGRGEEVIMSLDLSDPAVRQEFGDLIHNNWIERNLWVRDPDYGNPLLACSFSELSPEEQQKDIDQLAVLQEWLRSQQQ